MIRRRAAMAVAIAASALVVWWLPTGSPAGASSGSATAPAAVRSAHVASMPAAGDAEREFIDDINQLRQGKGLNAMWRSPEKRSAFVGTFNLASE